MLIGRTLRKEISQLFAFGLYRMVALWVLVALCASYGRVGLVMSFGIIALSICINSVHRGTKLLIEEQSNRDWKDRLTNRFFYELFWENWKSDNREYLDIMKLFREASDKANEDIKTVSDQDKWDPLDKTSWHLVGGVLHFFSLLIGDVIYYGSAIWVGTQWQH